jgi:WD40 repeat protein
VSAGQDHRVRIWDLADDTETLALTGDAGAVLSVAFSPRGTHIAAGFEYGAVRIWDGSGR